MATSRGLHRVTRDGHHCPAWWTPGHPRRRRGPSPRVLLVLAVVALLMTSAAVLAAG